MSYLWNKSLQWYLVLYSKRRYFLVSSFLLPCALLTPSTQSDSNQRLADELAAPLRQLQEAARKVAKVCVAFQAGVQMSLGVSRMQNHDRCGRIRGKVQTRKYAFFPITRLLDSST